MSCAVGFVSWGRSGTWDFSWDFRVKNHGLALKVGQPNVTGRNYNPVMAQTHSTPSQVATALDALSEDDRAWLTERLVEYRELLTYLHAN